jgi:hypothetical protein
MINYNYYTLLGFIKSYGKPCCILTHINNLYNINLPEGDLFQLNKLKIIIYFIDSI